MKKVMSTIIALILLVSVGIPVSALEVAEPETVYTGIANPQVAILRSGSSIKNTYYDITATYKGIPFQIRLAWSLTYFVNTGQVNSCSTPSVSVTIPDSYQYSDMLIPRLKDVSTKAYKSGEYACEFTATYEPVIGVSQDGWIEYFKSKETFTVRVTADGEVSIK